MPSNPNQLTIEDLNISFHTEKGLIQVVEGLSLSLQRGQTLGIVGESGCGKSVTALSIMRLLPSNAQVSCQSLLFEGKNIHELPPEALKAIRGNQISMIFQEPMSSLNPVFTVEFQISECMQIHQPEKNPEEQRERTIELLRLVGIPSPIEQLSRYPHELSGGMRQRVMIAMALVCSPKILIADEPTTALDVTIQAQILDLLDRLQKQLGMSVILITHDLGVVAEHTDQVLVMYAGKVVEKASVTDLFSKPMHPYTQGLIASIPTAAPKSHRKRLDSIPGVVPSPKNFSKGCRFHDRCSWVQENCLSEVPPLEPKTSDHWVACFESKKINDSN